MNDGRFDVSDAIDCLLSEAPLVARAVRLLELQVALVTFQNLAESPDGRLVIECDPDLLAQAGSVAIFAILMDYRKSWNEFRIDSKTRTSALLILINRLFEQTTLEDPNLSFLSDYFELYSFRKKLVEATRKIRKALPFWDYSINVSANQLSGPETGGVSSARLFMELDVPRHPATRRRFPSSGLTYAQEYERKFRPLAHLYYVGIKLKMPILPIVGSWYYLGPRLLQASSDISQLSKAFGLALSASARLSQRGYKGVSTELSQKISPVAMPHAPILD